MVEPLRKSESTWRGRGPSVATGAVLLALAVGACAAPEARGSGALARVAAGGELRWGADEQGGEPYAYEDPARGGALVGFEVDLADALAESLGVRARMVQNDWSTLIPSLERGTFDVALNGIEVTPARAARVSFTRPYYLFAERLCARRGDGRIRDLSSLRGLRVGTLANTQAWDLLRAAGADAVPYEGVDEQLVDLEHARTDAVLLDDVMVARYLPRHPALVAVGDVAEGRYAIALRPADEELRAALDGALGQMIASGAWRRTLARWGLDDDRQQRLAALGAAPPPPAAKLAPRALTPEQLLLFGQGALVTLLLSLAAMAIAAPLGLALALARVESARLRPLAAVYVEIVRGTPVLLQLYLLYYGLAGVVSLGPFTAAIVGLGLNYAAYESEIYRAAINAVPRAQWEAALAVGATRRAAFRQVILPQALRLAVPGMTNDFISLLKDSSLVSVLTVVELTKRMTITAVDNRGWIAPGLLCAALYFALGYPFTRLSHRLERRLGAHGST
ncbi:MAG TPA: ABC transporter substrate-binding protein/permease [Polyangia bacterium]|nr:ABC transporter substrate-binding protein/permease [Polyangia bacterium]